MKPLNLYIDHTALKPETTKADIKKLCNEAIKYKFFSVCVNSCYISYVSELLRETDISVTSVIGFPLGTMDTSSKVFETKTALENGADEIDMVINVGALKEGDYKYIKNDIYEVASEVYQYDAILKVILETCLLTDEEIIKACKIAVDAGADFVKTSTGFNSGGATIEHVKLMKEAVHNEALIKASGGIRDYETALNMIEAGADRLGVSASVSIMEGK